MEKDYERKVVNKLCWSLYVILSFYVYTADCSDISYYTFLDFMQRMIVNIHTLCSWIPIFAASPIVTMADCDLIDIIHYYYNCL